MPSEAMDSRLSKCLAKLSATHVELLTDRDKITKWIKFSRVLFEKMNIEQRQEYVETLADCWSLILIGRGLPGAVKPVDALNDMIAASVASGLCYPIVVTGPAIVRLFSLEMIPDGVQLICAAVDNAKLEVAQELRELAEDLQFREIR